MDEVDNPKDKCPMEDGTFNNLGLENEEHLRREIKGDKV